MASVTRGNTAHRAKRAAAAARILEATERLLRDGERFTEIPVERLLEEADVSRSTFYVHFADKSALLMGVAEKAVTEVAATGERWWQYDHATGPDGAAATVREMIKVYRRHAPILRTLNEVASYDDEIRDLRRLRRGAAAKVLAERVLAEQRQGLVPAEVDVELTASVITQLVDNAIIEHVAHGSPRNDRKLAETLARIGWLAFYGKVPAASEGG